MYLQKKTWIYIYIYQKNVIMDVSTKQIKYENIFKNRKYGYI